jgi:hypothetical protein
MTTKLELLSIIEDIPADAARERAEYLADQED